MQKWSIFAQQRIIYWVVCWWVKQLALCFAICEIILSEIKLGPQRVAVTWNLNVTLHTISFGFFNHTSGYLWQHLCQMALLVMFSKNFHKSLMRTKVKDQLLPLLTFGGPPSSKKLWSITTGLKKGWWVHNISLQYQHIGT